MYYRRFLALLLFLLLCFSASADYWITEAELSELEALLTQSELDLQASQAQLALLKVELKTLQDQSIALQTKSKELEQYWIEYASAQRKTKTVLTLALAATSGALIISLYR
jgi:septal ring factor EnvC (AmiA/AmiB activator)